MPNARLLGKVDRNLQILCDYNSGMLVKDIAVKHSISRQRVWTILQDMGYEPRGRERLGDWIVKRRIHV